MISRISSYIRDTTDFLNKLHNLPHLPPGSLLVTLDVSSLYTNIPHDEGVAACEEALNSRELLIPRTADLCRLIKLILSTNSFTFNEEYYLQVHGTAMGTRMAPSYANLFMGKLEQQFLHTQERVLSYGGDTSMMFLPFGPTANLPRNHSWMNLINIMIRLNLRLIGPQRKSLF